MDISNLHPRTLNPLPNSEDQDGDLDLDGENSDVAISSDEEE